MAKVEPKSITTVEEAKAIASKTGIKPAVIKGTTIIRFVKAKDPRYTEITWEEVFKIIKTMKLNLTAYGTYLRVSKPKE